VYVAYAGASPNRVTHHTQQPKARKIQLGVVLWAVKGTRNDSDSWPRSSSTTARRYAEKTSISDDDDAANSRPLQRFPCSLLCTSTMAPFTAWGTVARSPHRHRKAPSQERRRTCTTSGRKARERSAAVLPLFCRCSAAVLPLVCRCSAAVLLLFCRYSAAILPLLCRCSAAVLPLLCRCLARTQ